VLQKLSHFPMDEDALDTLHTEAQSYLAKLRADTAIVHSSTMHPFTVCP